MSQKYLFTPQRVLNVFVSSTYLDLHTVRSRLLDMIEGAGFNPHRGMDERQRAQEGRKEKLPRLKYPHVWSAREVRKCDVLVMLLGGRWGARPYGDIDSPLNKHPINDIEFEAAYNSRMPILLYDIDSRLWDELDRSCLKNETIEDPSFRDLKLGKYGRKLIVDWGHLSLVRSDLQKIFKHRFRIAYRRLLKRLRSVKESPDDIDPDEEMPLDSAPDH